MYRLSDCSIWTNSDFGRMLENGEVELPPPKCLPSTNILMPHAFVGDEAFPLKQYMMRPFSKRQLGDAKRVFNYRLSRARRVIENFGILVCRWQILSKTICASPKNVTSYISALICLHNFLLTQQLEVHRQPDILAYCSHNLVDREDENHDLVEGEWRNETNNSTLRDITRLGSNNPAKSAQVQRDILKNYFVSPAGEQQAPWQYSAACRGAVLNMPCDADNED